MAEGSMNEEAVSAKVSAIVSAKGKRRTDNKTVTFGDAAAVTSLPGWALLGVVTLFATWFLTTTMFGFPSDLEAKYNAAGEADAIAQAEATGEPVDFDGLSDKELFQQCQRDGDNCNNGTSYTQIVSPLSFPSIPDTWGAAKEVFTEGFQSFSIWEHTWASLWRILRGMFWGSVGGIPIGLAMGLSSRARGFFDPLVEGFRPIPPLALLPLFILTFGIGDKAAVPLLIFASLWIMIIAARAGVRNASLSKVRASYSLGASKSQLLRKVLIPNALPEIFTGLRVALGVSWGTLVAAELTGVNDGLGAMISIAKNFSRLDVIVVGIVIISVIGVLMDGLIRLLEKILIPWQGKG